MSVFGKSAHNIFKYQVNNMGSTIAFYKETVAFQVTFWAWSPEWDLLTHSKTRTKEEGFSWPFILLVLLQALPLDLNKQGSRRVAQLYIVESLAFGMSPYSLSLVEVCFMVSVTVCDKTMSAFNMCVIKLESLYVLHLSVHIMARHWKFKKKCFLLPVQIFWCSILSIL
jgi:hypothetical protein